MDNNEHKTTATEAFNKATTFASLKDRFFKGEVYMVAQLEELRKLAIEFGEGDITELVDIALNYSQVINNLAANDDLDYLHKVQTVADLYNKYDDVGMIDAMIECRDDNPLEAAIVTAPDPVAEKTARQVAQAEAAGIPTFEDKSSKGKDGYGLGE